MERNDLYVQTVATIAQARELTEKLGEDVRRQIRETLDSDMTLTDKAVRIQQLCFESGQLKSELSII